jgi:hypothetical protein
MKYLIPFTLLFFVSCVKEDILLPKQAEATYQPIQFDKVDEFLSTPAFGAKLIIPVVVINYIPSKDKGKTLDQTTFPFRNDRGDFDPNLPVSEYKKWLLSGDIRTKAGIEEGSKFRNSTTPYVGIKVIRYINVYEIPKIERKISESRFAIDSTEAYYPDYKKLFKELNIEDLVNNQGVKEIWFNRKSLCVPETNMSSPSSKDISNGYYEQDYKTPIGYNEETDLPIYNKTYVVYSHFIHNGYDFNLHVRGHQIERQMSHINNTMWNNFVGSRTANGKGCGNTHYPVNAVRAYDYNNTTPIKSDINNWNPNGNGPSTSVSSTSWIKNIIITLPPKYAMPTSTYKTETSRNVIGNDPQGGWMIYWFQSIPSKDNNIPYGNKKLTDWWDIYYNWDDAIINKKNLFKDGN